MTPPKFLAQALISSLLTMCRLNPLSEFKYDGLSAHPYEVMFVPMSTIAIENGWSFAKLAAQYETWMSLQVSS